jgi:hypothetical protein
MFNNSLTDGATMPVFGGRDVITNWERRDAL